MPPPAPQAPKTNADFRRMLETPRADRSEESAPGGARTRRQKASGEPGEAKKKSRRSKPVAEDDEGDAEDKYRCARGAVFAPRKRAQAYCLLLCTNVSPSQTGLLCLICALLQAA